MSKLNIAEVFESKKSNIWMDLQIMLVEHKPVDLAVGYANYLPPKEVIDCLTANSFYTDSPLHQYSSNIAGHPKLLEAIAKYYSPILSRKISATDEVLVTIGATHAIDTAIRSHVNKNEEVIIIEPSFTIYEPMIKSVGGIVRYVTLKPDQDKIPTSSGDFVFDYEELEKAFNKNTKMIIINSPQNPTGKLLTEKECTVIADLCKKWDVICLSDDVYEELVYAPNKLFKIATLPNMWERTITVGSVGKMFHITGWKTGWAYGGPQLLKNMKTVFIDTTYSCVTPIQEAVANCIEREIDNNMKMLQKTLKDLEGKRNYVVACLKEAGMHPIVPEAGYFIAVDWTNFAPFVETETSGKPTGLDFIKWLIKTCKVLCIPIDSFYCEKTVDCGDRYIRIAFIRDMDTLTAGMEAIKMLKNYCTK